MSWECCMCVCVCVHEEGQEPFHYMLYWEIAIFLLEILTWPRSWAQEQADRSRTHIEISWWTFYHVTCSIRRINFVKDSFLVILLCASGRSKRAIVAKLLTQSRETVFPFEKTETLRLKTRTRSPDPFLSSLEGERFLLKYFLEIRLNKSSCLV